MRLIIARAICWLTLGTVLALSLQFAAVHNPRVALTGAPVAATPNVSAAKNDARKKPETHERGQVIYTVQKCATCHSVAGVGNPRYPLDGVGMRWDEAELRAWITGTGIAAEVLSPQVIKRKQRYRLLPEDDMRELVGYLASLQTDFAREGTMPAAAPANAGGLP